MIDAKPAPDVYERIDAHGLTLRRMNRGDIEQVRQWRNDPAVNSFMESRETITSEMQARWFARLDPKRQFFYLIEADGVPLGVVNLKNFDASGGTAESGIYLADPTQRGRGIGKTAYRALLEHGFHALGLHNVTAHVLNDNHRSIRLHTGLGFQLAPEQDGHINQLYVLSRHAYRELSQDQPDGPWEVKR